MSETQANSINAPTGSPIGTLPSRCLEAGLGADPSRHEADGHAIGGSPDAIIVGGNTSPYMVAAETKMDIVNTANGDCITRWPTSDYITKVSAAGPLAGPEGSAETEPAPPRQHSPSSEGNVRPE